MTPMGGAITPAFVLASRMFLADYAQHVRFSPDGMVKINLFETHRMFADLYCLMPRHEQRVHAHDDNDKLYLVLEGSGSFVVGDEEQVLGAGGVCIAPSGDPHGVRNDSKENLVLLVMMAPHPRLRE